MTAITICISCILDHSVIQKNETTCELSAGLCMIAAIIRCRCCKFDQSVTQKCLALCSAVQYIIDAIPVCMSCLLIAVSRLCYLSAVLGIKMSQCAGQTHHNSNSNNHYIP